MAKFYSHPLRLLRYAHMLGEKFVSRFIFALLMSDLFCSTCGAAHSLVALCAPDAPLLEAAGFVSPAQVELSMVGTASSVTWVTKGHLEEGWQSPWLEEKGREERRQGCQ